MLLGYNSIDRSYDYIHSQYGWIGVMFALLLIAFGVMATYTFFDRRK